MKHMSPNRLLQVLDIIRFVLVLFLIAMFVSFNTKIAQQSAQTQVAANNTSRLVKNQADILNAIKAVTDDTHSTAAQQTAIIICMLQVPVGSRTTDLQNQCRSQVNALSVNSNAGSSQGSKSTTPQDSSTNSTSANDTGQSNSSQLSSCRANILFLRLGC